MSTKPSSRWADTPEDLAHEARRKKEKAEKKRQKAERSRLEAAARAQTKLEDYSASATSNTEPSLDDTRSTKRRRITAPQDNDSFQTEPEDPGNDSAIKMLRFEGGSFGPPSSLYQGFSKLNNIAEGTYGRVWRAECKQTGNVFAVKQLKSEDSGNKRVLPLTGLREIQILRDCDHRNIVKIVDVIVKNTTPPIETVSLVLDFIEHDIRTLLCSMPEPFLGSEVKTLLHQLVSGVAYLHDHWILHRDLKTSNLLLTNRGVLKIADFGMARYVGDPPPADLTQVVVTLWYRAPELLLGATSYDGAVDMWSIGCIFAELMTRTPLLQGSVEADQWSKIMGFCGPLNDQTWPGFGRLPLAQAMKASKYQSRENKHSANTAESIVKLLPQIAPGAKSLMQALLSLNPTSRPRAKQVLGSEYFSELPKAKQEHLFPTFPSKARQEARTWDEPRAPTRGKNLLEGDD
ncbi:Serine/threonine-protein kinase ppk23 [Ceratocystis platani]|uniref:cyclin-dependent kinase n=1 Tax=Ceratocystis fimbriata f. sp. platani TaxID=88771 RepID=A0A0F8B313_CERFI|nr:Serine/threonine-protein kinase ppk23 [Ceratocystis platani]